MFAAIFFSIFVNKVLPKVYRPTVSVDMVFRRGVPLWRKTVSIATARVAILRRMAGLLAVFGSCGVLAEFLKEAGRANGAIPEIKERFVLPFAASDARLVIFRGFLFAVVAHSFFAGRRPLIFVFVIASTRGQ